MSIDSALGRLQSITTTIGSASNTVTRLTSDLGPGKAAATTGVPGGVSGAWLSQLRPASYRGVPFGVLSSSGKFGRRQAVHEYPYRDTVWVEDMGRAARRINISGFLVGDDVIAQRERLIVAVETAGEGELIHPTLGQLNVSNVAMSTDEEWEKGRVFHIQLSFIEAGVRVFPSVETSTKSVVASACTAADAAVKADFSTTVSESLKKGAAVVAQAASTAATWGRKAQRLANDATNLYNMVGTLSGSLGRYSKGGGLGKLTATIGAVSSVASSVPKLIALGSAARTAVDSAIIKLSSTASDLGT